MSDFKVGFIGVGGQKCASTWIYDILVGHPEVCLSRDKEIDFFSNFWDRGYDWYSTRFDKKKANNSTAVGEASPSYLYDSDTPKRVAQYNKDMKIIVTVRKPIDRAYSNHKHNIRQGFVSVDDLSFEKSLNNNPTYIEHGLYGRHITNWLTVFPREQLLLIFFEDIVSSPVEVAESIYAFLGISETFQSEFINKKSNESVAVANVRLARHVDLIRNAIQSSSLAWLWGLLKVTGVRSLYRAINMRDVDTAIPKMLPSTRAYLAGVYKDDISLLESISGRTLKNWIE